MRILDTARALERSLDREVKKLPTLRGRLVVNLFYESSTRTLSSFELAAKRLSADTMTLRSSGSSVEKGESLRDTAETLGAYDPDVIVIRHPHIGAPHIVADATDALVVNAGDGKHQHPTQALLDLFTIREALGRLEDVRVAIVGDVLHSRVARSLVEALLLVGASPVAIGPPTLMPRGIEALGCDVSDDIEAAADADVVYVLRMQQERMDAAFVPSLREYTSLYGVTPEPRPARPGRDAPRPDEPGRRDRPARRRLGRVPDHDAGAGGARRADGGALRPAHGPGPPRRARRCSRSPECSPAGTARATRSRSAPTSSTPGEGLDGPGVVTIEDGVVTAVESVASAPGGARPRAGVRRPARAPADAGARGRGDDRLGHRRGGRRRVLRDRRDAEHRARRRHGPRAPRAARAGARGGGRPDGVHGRDLARPARRGAHRDGRARGGRCARVHRRRPTRLVGRPDAAGARVQRGRRRPLALHCEELSLSDGGHMHEGAVSAQLGLAGWPSVAESLMVERDLALAAYERRPVHLQHLSARESVEAVRRARAAGVAVSAEASPHHLCATDERVRTLDANVKMNPPLRTEADRRRSSRASSTGRSTASPPITPRTRATRRTRRSRRRPSA